LNKNRQSINTIPLIILILAGIVILFFDFFYYPQLLPKVITSENSKWIESSSYIFYAIFVSSIVIEILSIRQIIRSLSLKFNDYDNNVDEKSIKPSSWFSSTHSKSNFSLYGNDKKQESLSILKILFDMVTDKKSIIFFLPATVIYGFFYAIISSTFIIRLGGGISHISGIEKFPSIIMMQYGPIGYTPSMSIYLNDNMGILIIPINLIVIIIISVLVGLNVVSSIYAFKSYRFEKKRKEIVAIRPAINNGTKFLSVLGATTSLFAACPTCASFYLFNILAGSFVTTIASFTVNYYTLIILFSVPLLIITPIINALNIKKMRMSITNQCRIKEKK
jgi:hypothetical protein